MIVTGQADNSQLVSTNAIPPESCMGDRAGESPSEGLTEALLSYGFETDRLKTGTPARVDSRSVDFTNLEAQHGDKQVKWFSFDDKVGCT